MSKKYMRAIFFKVGVFVASFSFLVSPLVGPLIAGAATTTPAVSGNLILNPQMLTATVSSSTPDHWAQGGFNASTTYTYPVAGPQAGDLAAQVNVTSISNGAAEWFFDPVAVTPGTTYAFSDWYNSNATSYLIVQWTLGTSTLKFEEIAILDPTNGAWMHTPQEVFTPPANATSMSILHLIESVGSLTISNSSLVTFTPSAQDALPQGIVSLTFDDGWTSQYDNAWPLLKTANVPATFYIITNPMKAASGDVFTEPQEQIVTATTTNGTTWSEVFPDPSISLYRFSDTYQGSGTSTITVTYKPLSTATTSTSTILAASPSPSRSSFAFTLPVLASSTPIVITHTSASALTATNPVLNRYGLGTMSSSQILDLLAAGNEIGAHTTDHCNLFQLDKDPNSATTVTGQCVPTLLVPTTAQTEINTSKTDLQNVGITTNTFAYPYGSYDANIKTLITSDGFKASRSVDIGYNTKQSDLLALKAQSIDVTTSLADVESWINYAAANKVWLILLFHQVEDPATLTSNGEDGGTTPTELGQILDYINTQNVSVKTVDQALAFVSGATTTPPTIIPITILPSTLPNGTVGTAYNQTLSASTTATGPFTWNISSGSLPTGLTFATSSPIISGTPTTIGTSTFNVGVTNGSASTTQSYTINIVGTTTATSTATSTSPGTGGGTTGGGSSSGGGVVTSFGRSGGHSGGRIATSTLVINPGILTAGNSIQPFIFTRTLSFPMRNDDVMQLQKRLSSEGFFNGPITGYFGNLTRAAVRAYQKAKNISPVGTVGPMTRSFLNR